MQDVEAGSPDPIGWSRGPVAITGAGGHVGRFLQAELRRRAIEVHPVRRGGDPAAIRAADAVVHLAGTLQPRGQDTYETANVETMRGTVAALAASSVRRVVFLSYAGAGAASANAYLRSKGEAEELLAHCGREVVIVRSTFVFGPGERPGPSMTPLLSKGGRPVTLVGSGRQRCAPVAVEDVVETLARFALDPTTPTGTFSLAGPDTLSLDALVDALGGGHVRKRHLGRRLARALSHLLPALTPAMVEILAADSLPETGIPGAAEALGLELRRLDRSSP